MAVDRVRTPRPRIPGRCDAKGHRHQPRRRRTGNRQALLASLISSQHRRTRMELPLYQIDAFTSRLFAGNPAGVCPLPRWLPDATLQAIAAENNVAETAFFLPVG